MSRRDASPEAETTSYSPVFIRVTISSDVLPILLLTLQPVLCSKPVTQSTLLSVEPFSTYPAQDTTLTWPSPGPSEANLSIFGGVRPPGPPPPGVVVSPPQPARARTTAAAAVAANRILLIS